MWQVSEEILDGTVLNVPGGRTSSPACCPCSSQDGSLGTHGAQTAAVAAAQEVADVAQDCCAQAEADSEGEGNGSGSSAGGRALPDEAAGHVPVSEGGLPSAQKAAAAGRADSNGGASEWHAAAAAAAEGGAVAGVCKVAEDAGAKAASGVGGSSEGGTTATGISSSGDADMHEGAAAAAAGQQDGIGRAEAADCGQVCDVGSMPRTGERISLTVRHVLKVHKGLLVGRR